MKKWEYYFKGIWVASSNVGIFFNRQDFYPTSEVCQIGPNLYYVSLQPHLYRVVEV